MYFLVLPACKTIPRRGRIEQEMRRNEKEEKRFSKKTANLDDPTPTHWVISPSKSSFEVGKPALHLLHILQVRASHFANVMFAKSY